MNLENICGDGNLNTARLKLIKRFKVFFWHGNCSLQQRGKKIMNEEISEMPN
jgi:hypothetical protein